MTAQILAFPAARIVRTPLHFAAPEVAVKLEAPKAKATAFEVGKTYTTRSACDYETVFRFVVVKRTAKRLTLRTHGREFVRGIVVWDGVESCKPYGTYSMCPVIRADKAAE